MHLLLTVILGAPPDRPEDFFDHGGCCLIESNAYSYLHCFFLAQFYNVAFNLLVPITFSAT